MHHRIVYATHILDNLAGWPTHLVHMHLGTQRVLSNFNKFWRCWFTALNRLTG